MQFTPFLLAASESEKLLTYTGEAQSTAIRLYIYLRNGNPAFTAKTELGLTAQQQAAALTALRELDLYNTPQPPEAKPSYSETDVLEALQTQVNFKALTQEVQYRLGRTLSVNDYKILLNISNYLGLPNDVICVLISHMITRAREKGQLKSPSMFQIEQEAYRWSDKGIDSMEAAFTYIHKDNQQQADMDKLLQLLHIRGRILTAPEERYAKEWLQMGLSDDLLRMAYEKTCLKTGGLSWAYMNKILVSWKQAGYRSPADVKSRGKAQSVPTGASGHLGDAELEAIQRVLAMDFDRTPTGIQASD